MSNVVESSFGGVTVGAGAGGAGEINKLPTAHITNPPATTKTCEATNVQASTVVTPTPGNATPHTVPRTTICTSTANAPAGVVNPMETIQDPSKSISTAPALTNSIVTIPIPSQLGQPSAKKSKKSKSKPSGDKSSQGSQGENTGRWTAEEHRLFLQGLEEHGKGWKKIASLIKSRTVVQIRTHAQKYFQKLAKARQNGEEGDVSMEGRGGGAVGTTCGSPVSGGVGLNGATIQSPHNNNSQAVKRRRHNSHGSSTSVGTKRKSLAGVVQSAQRDAAIHNGEEGMHNSMQTSRVLAPYLVPNHPGSSLSDFSNTALEDSLYRFLTPATTSDFTSPSPILNEQPLTVAQNNVNASPNLTSTVNPSNNPVLSGQSITLPSSGVLTGEGSPTSVADVLFSPSLLKEPEPPQWYTRGSDVDDLLNEAEALDWLTDSGDLDETYKHTTIPLSSEVVSLCTTSESEPEECNTPSLSNKNIENHVTKELPQDLTCSKSLSPVVSCSVSMNELPSLFDSSDHLSNKRMKLSNSSSNLFTSATDVVDAPTDSTSMEEDEHFSVFDSAFDEQAFVSALLESNDNNNLQVLS